MEPRPFAPIDLSKVVPSMQIILFGHTLQVLLMLGLKLRSDL